MSSKKSLSYALVSCLLACWLSVLFWYGNKVFLNGPWLDDWNAIADLKIYLAGGNIIHYLLSLNNNHYEIITRIIYLILYYVSNLNLEIMRWATLFSSVIVGVIFTLIYFKDESLIESQRYVNKSTIQSKNNPYLIILIVMITTTLGQWEVYSAAQDITNIAVNIMSIISILLFDKWLNEKQWHLFIGAIVFAYLAWLNFAYGALLFVAYAAFLIVLKRWKERKVAFIIISISAILTVLLEVHNARVGAMPSNITGVIGGKYPLREYVLGALNITGVGIVWGIYNKPLIPAVAGCGLFIIYGIAHVLWRDLKVSSSLHTNSVTNKYWILIVYGVLVNLSILVGRLDAGADYMAISRYVPASELAILGLVLYLHFHFNAVDKSQRIYRGLLYSLIVAGFVLTNYSELHMAKYRRQYGLDVVSFIKAYSSNTTSVEIHNALMVNSVQAPVVPTVIPWLKENKLSLFSSDESAGK